jgi:hypothetical protein
MAKSGPIFAKANAQRQAIGEGFRALRLRHPPAACARPVNFALVAAAGNHANGLVLRLTFLMSRLAPSRENSAATVSGFWYSQAKCKTWTAHQVIRSGSQTTSLRIAYRTESTRSACPQLAYQNPPVEAFRPEGNL